MTDMLVRLYNLPPFEPQVAAQAALGITIRRAIAPEKNLIGAWVEERFGQGWRSECETSFSHAPPACWIATENGQLLGFACYDATAKAFFGPTGVDKTVRGRGTGMALLLACLHSLRWEGYAYGIIGGVGPVDFYKKVGATIIEDSSPGVYKGMLRAPKSDDEDDEDE